MRRSMLVHPVAVSAVLVLLLNDHVLKFATPGWLTGKLSDVAGLAFFPLLLGVVAGGLIRRDARRLVPAAAAATAAVFTLVKLTAFGASAFAWSLGATQWFVAMALTGHATLEPVAVVRDPLDLLALPAVLVAIAVAHRVPQPPPETSGRAGPRVGAARLAPAAMALAMAVSTMATSQSAGPLPTTVSNQQVVTLTTAEPMVARHVHWEVSNPDPGAEASLAVTMSKPGDEYSDAEGAAWMVIPDDRAQRFHEDTGSLEFLCNACSGGATVVAWLLDGPDAPHKLVVQITETMTMPTVGDQAPAITLTAEAPYSATPTVIKASVTMPFSVSLDDKGAHDDQLAARARLDASALDSTAAWPLVGRVVIDSRGTSAARSKDDYGVGPETVSGPDGALGDDAWSTDWLGACKPDRDCTFEIFESLSYEDWSRETTAYRHGWVRGDVTITVLLIAFDGRDLPANALSIKAKA